jgi:hypothetical protein
VEKALLEAWCIDFETALMLPQLGEILHFKKMKKYGQAYGLYDLI